METLKYILISVIFFLFLQSGCINDPVNEEATGLFSVQVSGDTQEKMEGQANFDLLSRNQYSYVIVKLEVDELNFVRITFLNPSSSSLFIEPGTYNIVPQFNVGVNREVLLDYFNEGVKSVAESGSVAVRISKEIQIKGNIASAGLPDINSSLTGNFDAKRE